MVGGAGLGEESSGKIKSWLGRVEDPAELSHVGKTPGSTSVGGTLGGLKYVRWRNQTSRTAASSMQTGIKRRRLQSSGCQSGEFAAAQGAGKMRVNFCT